MTELKPKLIIIAGPNGSGKTSVTHKILQHNWMEGCVYVNPWKKHFGRVLTSHVDDFGKSKFQADLEGTFEVMDAHLPQEVELQTPLLK